ncbi:MAG: hypothetical protein WKG00_00200 [Polyangiaceae bacterium]
MLGALGCSLDDLTDGDDTGGAGTSSSAAVSSGGAGNQGGSGASSSGGQGGASAGGAGGSQPSNELWARGFGSLNDTQKGTAVAVDPSCPGGGCVVFAGYLTGSANFGGEELSSAGSADGFVVSLDATGKHRWSAVFGDGSDQRVAGVAIGPDGGPVIAGRVRGAMTLPGDTLTLTAPEVYDGFVAKLDPASGSAVWAAQFGEASDTGSDDNQYAETVAVDADGNVIVAGLFGGTMVIGSDTLTSSDDQDVFVAKLDPLGAPIWALAVEGTASSNVATVAVGAAGEVYLGGVFTGSLGAGCTPAVTAQGTDPFVIALAPADGACLWARTWKNGSSTQFVRALAAVEGDVVAAMDINGDVDLGSGLLQGSGYDVGLTRLSGDDGTPLWGWRTDDALNQNAADVAVDASNGDIVLTGYYAAGLELEGLPALFTTNGPDIFLARFTAAGAALWAEGFGEESGDDRAFSVAVDAAGAELLTGAFTQTIDFGTTEVMSYGVDDIFIAKFGPGAPAP